MYRLVSPFVVRPSFAAFCATLALGVAAAGGCGVQQGATAGGYTSIPQPDATNEAASGSDPQAQQPNAAGAANAANVPTQAPAGANANATPSDATPATPANGNAGSGNVLTLAISNGFGLMSTATNKCLASADATPRSGSTLVLAPCANSNAQAFSYLKGQLALMRSLCVTSGGVGSKLTLSACNTASSQIWEINGASHAMQHTMSDAPAASVVVVDGSGNVVAQASGSGSPLALFPITLAGTDGMRVHARSAGNVDLCLADVGGTVAMQPCETKTDEQVWDFSNNQFVSVKGRRCLTGDTSGLTVSVGACATPVAANQSWYIMNYFLSLMTPYTTNNDNALVLVLNGSNLPILDQANGAQVRFSLGAPGPAP